MGAPLSPHPSLQPKNAVYKSFSVWWARREEGSWGRRCRPQRVLRSLVVPSSTCSGSRLATTPGLPACPPHQAQRTEG